MAQPNLIPMPFAENATPGTIEPIPATNPTVPQDATWSAGFPQVTMQPLASGGIPPRGQNFNGVLNALSQHIFHMQGGGQYKWDDAHGPYSIGDVLQSDDGLRSYVSVVDNNTDNFNTTPSAIGDTWLPWSGGAASELVAGLIQIATSAQAQALTDNTRAITPSKLAAAFSGANQNGLGSTSWSQKLPGGLMIQGGSMNVNVPSGPTVATGNVTFFEAFSSGNVTVVPAVRTSNPDLINIGHGAAILTGFSCSISRSSGSAGAIPMEYIAFGRWA